MVYNFIVYHIYGIPKELREFWYSERPDILDFMERKNHQLDVNFWPLITTPKKHSILDSTTFMDPIINTLRGVFGLI